MARIKFCLKKIPGVCASRWAARAVWAVLWANLWVGQANGAWVNGAWRSPLSAAEIQQATGIALADAAGNQLSPQNVRGVSAHAYGTAAVHPLGVQVLLTELLVAKNHAAAEQRLVEVFLFDYQQGTTQLKLIDVEHGTVVNTQFVSSVHLPLTDAEIQYASALMLDHAALQARVRTELVGMSHPSANGPIELPAVDARISIWVPVQGQSAAANCASERCALVSLFTVNDESLTVEPVVNLSRGTVSIDLFQ